MVLRTFRERIIQTLCCEAGALLFVVPTYQLIFGGSVAQSAALIVALAVTVAFWSPLHNTVFDLVEFHFTQRVASDRPQRWRTVHAILHEVTSAVVTVPVILLMTDHDFWTALLIDIGLTVFYTAYIYAFHIVFDRWRPVQDHSRGDRGLI